MGMGSHLFFTQIEEPGRTYDKKNDILETTTNNTQQQQEEDVFTFIPNVFIIEGLSICWSSDKVFVLDLQRQEKETYQARYNMRCVVCVIQVLKLIQNYFRLSFVKKMFERPSASKILFDMKPHIKILFSHDITSTLMAVLPSVAKK